ncbi:MAG TPA: trypsin-like peptidase domain-containing protein [Acidimicrobiales bacterium]|nr:trypsin-like peptidase domain-containing protein [Acidimicrobiales bacterium]
MADPPPDEGLDEAVHRHEPAPIAPDGPPLTPTPGWPTGGDDPTLPLGPPPDVGPPPGGPPPRPPVQPGPPSPLAAPAPTRPARGVPWLPVLLAGVVLGGAAGGVVGGFIGANRASQHTVVEQLGGSDGASFQKQSPVAVRAVLARVLPAVVTIHTQAVQAGGLFGVGSQEVTGAGTGMIVTAGGDVLTNNHVIAGATQVTVTLYGQTQARTATVLGTDPTDDIAVLRIDGVSGLSPVTLGNSSRVQIGDDVLAVGNALDLSVSSPTVTEGIISATNRTIQTGDSSNPTVSENLTDMLQTDAAISSGNSGGPLVAADGTVIGMNTAVAGGSSSTGAVAQNIGFAIPVDKIKSVLPQLQSGQSLAHASAYIGVQVVDLTPQLRQAYGFAPTTGAVVASVTPNSPADNAGLQVGDVITALGRTTVASATDLTQAVRQHKPGDRVDLTVFRGSQQLTITVVLGSRAGGQ